jgi:hypothetical protein
MRYERLVTHTTYEWDYESIDEHGDIIDHDFCDKCPGVPIDPNISLVLVRNVGEGYNSDPISFDLIDRSWAYVKRGKLPQKFEDGNLVPKRFHAELQRIESPTRSK